MQKENTGSRAALMGINGRRKGEGKSEPDTNLGRNLSVLLY